MSAQYMPTNGESSKPRASPAPAKPDDDAKRHKILVVGWRKAGKTSCIKTVFQGVPVKDVPYFGTTQKIEKINYDTIIPLQIWDTPSSFELDQLDIPLASFSTIVYVMDMQQDDSYHDSLLHFLPILTRAHLLNPSIHFAIFIHKAEVLSEDYRSENYAEIQRAMAEELEDFRYDELQALAPPGVNFDDPGTVAELVNHLASEIRFDMTSCHDVSLRDAWSKVVMGVMEMLPSVESLLLNFTETSGMDNSYLFDLKSRLVLATDNRHRNDATLEQVTEYLSRFLQFRDLYKVLHYKPLDTPEEQVNGDEDGADEEGNQEEEDQGEAEEDEEEYEPGWWDDEDPSKPWMTNSARMLPNSTITLWQFTPHLALVVILRTETWQARRGMIEYNLTFLRQGVRRILMEV